MSHTPLELSSSIFSILQHRKCFPIVRHAPFREQLSSPGPAPRSPDAHMLHAAERSSCPCLTRRSSVAVLLICSAWDAADATPPSAGWHPHSSKTPTTTAPQTPHPCVRETGGTSHAVRARADSPDRSVLASAPVGPGSSTVAPRARCAAPRLATRTWVRRAVGRDHRLPGLATDRGG